jgi:hypothetical protein
MTKKFGTLFHPTFISGYSNTFLMQSFASIYKSGVEKFLVWKLFCPDAYFFAYAISSCTSTADLGYFFRN